MSEDQGRRIWTFEFTVLFFAALLGFGNIAIFYGLAGYLERLGVDPAWRGLVIAAEPAMAVILRPFLGARLTTATAPRVILAALAGNGLCLLLYQFATGVPSLISLRVAHGVAFVCLVSAVTTLLAAVIPKGRSAQAFGLFSLATLTPFALLPPAAELLLKIVGDQSRVYALTALLIAPAMILAWPLHSRLGQKPSSASHSPPPDMGAILANLRQPGQIPVLAANLCLFTCSTMVFFYARGFALSLGAADAGLFFTLAFGAMAAVRLLGNAVFDKLNKTAALIATLAAWAACLAFMAKSGSPTTLFALAAGHGLCLGLAQPLLNAAMFDISPPHLRGLNLNLMLFAMDLGYFVGPLTGGFILAMRLGQPAVFNTAAAIALLASLILIAFVGRNANRGGKPLL